MQKKNQRLSRVLHSTPISSLSPRHPIFLADSARALRYAGLHVIQIDLMQASQMIERAECEDEALLRSALWRAAAALYARCFVSGARGMPKLEERDHLSDVGDRLRTMHDFVLDARNNQLSHAGATNREISSAHVVLEDPSIGRAVLTIIAASTNHPPPSAADLIKFRDLICKVITAVVRSSAAAHQSLVEEVSAMNLDELYSKALLLGGCR